MGKRLRFLIQNLLTILSTFNVYFPHQISNLPLLPITLKLRLYVCIKGRLGVREKGKCTSSFFNSEFTNNFINSKCVPLPSNQHSALTPNHIKVNNPNLSVNTEDSTLLSSLTFNDTRGQVQPHCELFYDVISL